MNEIIVITMKQSKNREDKRGLGLSKSKLYIIEEMTTKKEEQRCGI